MLVQFVGLFAPARKRSITSVTFNLVKAAGSRMHLLDKPS